MKAVDGVSFSLEARRDAGHRRRVRLRQERHRALAHAPGRRSARPHRRRLACGSTASTSSALDEAAMRKIRGNDISMIFQEPMTSLNPVMTIGRQIGEALIAAPAAVAARPRWRRAIEMLQLVRHPRARAARQGVPAPALRRHAPARHDRHGARLQSQGADRRRADLGARRHHPGADPRPDRQAAARARHRRDPHHPRPRRRGRDGGARDRHVCRPQGGGGRRRRAVRAAAAPLHARPDELDPAPRPDARARRASSPARLQEIPGMVPALSNLPQGCTFAPRCAFADDTLPRAVSALRGEAPRPLGRLLALRRSWRAARRANG